MSYYMGDFYQGDPFWGGLFSLAKRAVGAVTGFGGRSSMVVRGPMPGGAMTRVGEMVRAGAGTVQRAIIKHPVISAAGAAGALGALGGAAAERMMGPGGACPRGFHISKSKHAKHFGACVRNRRMRVTNVKALRRALRRAHGFERIARRVCRITPRFKKHKRGRKV